MLIETKTAEIINVKIKITLDIIKNFYKVSFKKEKNSQTPMNLKNRMNLCIQIRIQLVSCNIIQKDVKNTISSILTQAQTIRTFIHYLNTKLQKKKKIMKKLLTQETLFLSIHHLRTTYTYIHIYYKNKTSTKRLIIN